MIDRPTPSPVTHSDKITPMSIPLCGVWVLVFAIVALFFYPITAKRAAQTRQQLEERRGTV